MSTKINVRSPFYLKFSEPALPSVDLDCATINLQNLSVDEFGNVTLPTTDYGEIISYTSTAGDFADGKFAAVVGTTTSRTITFTISIPPNFANSGDGTINCNATATQPAKACTGGITNNGSIPNQSLNTGGNSVSIDLSSYFTGTVSAYIITNNNLDFFETSLDTNTLTIYSKVKAGVKKLLVEATSANTANCNSTQTIQITTTATTAWTSADAYLSGGSISQAGVIVKPTVNGTITAIKDSSGGSTITSYPANSTGSDRNVTLFFNVTVPTGYSNTGSTVEVSKTFSQPTAALPLFTCSIASLTNQAVYSSGSIVKGIADKGTITGFSPIDFDSVTSDAPRTVAYTITPPGSGYSNSGGSDISCNVTMTQPAIKPSIGSDLWFRASKSYALITKAQYLAQYPSATAAEQRFKSLESELEIRGIYGMGVTGRANEGWKLHGSNIEDTINTYVFTAATQKLFTLRQFAFATTNPTGGYYYRVTKTLESGEPKAAFLGNAYYIKVEPSGIVSEVWLVDWLTPSFTKIA